MRAMSLPALVVLLTVGCSPEKAEGPGEMAPLETEDVGGGFDDGISLESDVKGRPRSSGSAGVVPGDFPAGFPIHQPSTVVDFGRGFVVFTAQGSPGAVRESLAGRAVAAGWARSGGSFERDGRTVVLTVEPAGELASIRVEY